MKVLLRIPVSVLINAEGNKVETGKYYKVKLTVEEDNLEKIELKKNGEEITYTDGMEITEIGSYKITAIDKAGNEVTKVFEIIEEKDVIKPKIEISYTPTEETQGKVIAIISANEPISNVVTIKAGEEETEETWVYLPLSNNQVLIKEFSQNIETTVKVKDLSNNYSDEKELKINWIKVIDKEQPVITNIALDPDDWTNQDVTVTITAEIW